MPTISTRRLELVPATFARLTADLAGLDALGAALDATVPEDWPPPLFDHDAMRYALECLRADKMDERWCFYYIVLTNVQRRRMAIGVGGFKGCVNPVGEVEVGYSILPEFQRRGLAREALQAWVEFAFADTSVKVIVAHTLLGHQASIRVAESAGFTHVGFGEDGHAPEGHAVLRYERPRGPHGRAPAVAKPEAPQLGPSLEPCQASRSQA